MRIAIGEKQNRVLITYAFISITAILLTGLLLSFIYIYGSRIGGKLYDEIKLSNDLTSDITPPTEYILESYAIAMEFIYEPDQDMRDTMYMQIQELEAIYNRQHSYWERNLPDYGDLRHVFLVESYNHVQEFYDVFYDQIVPAVGAGDKEASIRAQIDLEKAYHNHRNSIDESILLVEQWRQKVFSTSNDLAERGIIIMVLIVVVMLGLSIPTGLFIYRSERSLMTMAFFDGLTGLPNRKQFVDKLDDLLSAPSKERFAVVFFDLDGFKQVNDTLGHAAGDLLLREVTARLSLIKHHDDMLGRFSGDEFALLIHRGLSDSEMLDYLGKLREIVLMPFVIKQTRLELSASFGVAIFPEDGTTSSELLKRADQAMYSTKSMGGNGVQFYHMMQNGHIQ